VVWIAKSPAIAWKHGLHFRLPFHLTEPLFIAADLIVILGTSVLTGITYERCFLGNSGSIQTYLGVGLIIFVNFSAISAARGNYRLSRLLEFRGGTRDVTLYWALVCSLLLVVAFSLKITGSMSRGATLSFFVMGWAAIVTWRAVLQRILTRTLADGGFAERKILVIAEEEGRATSKELWELRRYGYNPVKTFEIKQNEITAGGSELTSSIRATIDAVIETSRREQIEDVFLSIPWNHCECIERIVAELRVLPLPVHLLPDQQVALFLARPLIHVGNTRAVELKRSPLTAGEQLLKRTIDLLIGVLALVLLSPFMLLAALLIKFDSQGPVFFVQTRNGSNGRNFHILKFRTMHVLEDGPVIRQATRNDPRITRLGRVLRHLNIDEWPQLFNVIIGDMSLVGPRPHAAAHGSEYEKIVANYAFRHHMKPGITGWAQVNGLRGEIHTIDWMTKRVEFDLWYINNWSVRLDIKILIRTLILGCQESAY
jgi:Undecaprenyl-phosphate glucose phosphotransferase